jgi:hypothetical protein
VHAAPPPLPPPLDALAPAIGRGLAKNPEHRHPDALAFSRALDEGVAALERPARPGLVLGNERAANDRGPAWFTQTASAPTGASADVFSVRRPALAETPPANDARACSFRPDDHEAARCFDRGFALVSQKRFDEGLRHWERALELDPDNRTYQTNLKRLRERISRESSQGRERS